MKENIISNLIQGVTRFLRDEEGATAIEYGLIAALIAVVIILAVTGMGKSVANVFTEICGAITNGTCT